MCHYCLLHLHGLSILVVAAGESPQLCFCYFVQLFASDLMYQGRVILAMTPRLHLLEASFKHRYKSERLYTGGLFFFLNVFGVV